MQLNKQTSPEIQWFSFTHKHTHMYTHTHIHNLIYIRQLTCFGITFQYYYWLSDYYWLVWPGFLLRILKGSVYNAQQICKFGVAASGLHTWDGCLGSKGGFSLLKNLRLGQWCIKSIVNRGLDFICVRSSNRLIQITNISLSTLTWKHMRLQSGGSFTCFLISPATSRHVYKTAVYCTGWYYQLTFHFPSKGFILL